MPKTVALLVEPSVEYPMVLPNTGMNLGLLRIAGAIRKKFPEIEPYFWSAQINKATKEITHTQVKQFTDVLCELSPKYCFISALTCQIEEAIQLCREAHKFGVKVVVLGGLFATLVSDIAEQVLSDFDYIISGAGEIPCINIIKATENETHMDKVICSSRQGTIPSDTLSITPDYNIFQHDIACALELPATMELSRGCNNCCKFCTLVEKSRGIIYEKPKQLALQERELLRLGYTKAVICDDTFLCNKRMYIPMLEEMKRQSGMGLSKTILTRIDLITPEMVNLFKKYNVSEVIIGVEHIDSSILKNMGKTSSPNEWKHKVVESLKLLSQNNIISHPIYMLGWVGETQSTLNNLVDFAIIHGQHESVQPFVSFCTPHPRSYMWNNRKSIGLELFPASLASYTHLSPVAFPMTLGDKDKSLELLVNAHNSIRTETNGLKRNPLIDLGSPFISGTIEKLLIWDGEQK